jgi:hypothetical protein
MGLHELQRVHFGLSCHTPAAVIFIFLRGTSNRAFSTPKVVRLHTAPCYKILAALCYGTLIDLFFVSVIFRSKGDQFNERSA